MSLSGSIKLLRSSSSSAGSDQSGSTRSTNFRFLSWSLDTLSPRELVDRFPLPRVVRVRDTSGSSPSGVDLSQPVLLYKTFRGTKVQARSLKASRSRKWKALGPNLIIPDTYTGWFSLVTETGQATAPCFSSISQVASAHVPFFLSRFDVPAYRLVDAKDPSGKTLYARTTVRAGYVLKLLGVFQDLNARKSPHRLHMGRPRSTHNPHEVKYAQCLNHRNEVLFLPFSAMGQFHAAATRGSRSLHHVYQLSQLLRTHQFPLRVQLIHGFLPNANCKFTGTLVLECYHCEETILACSNIGHKDHSPVLFEISLESPLRFSSGQEEQRLGKSLPYQAAIQFCAEQGSFWCQQIRASTRSLPEKPQQSPTSNFPSMSSGPTYWGSASRMELRRSRSLNDKMEIQTLTLALSLEDLGEEEREGESEAVAFSGVKAQSRPALFRCEDRQRRQIFPEEPPYCRVADDVADEENIYAEICDAGEGTSASVQKSNGGGGGGGDRYYLKLSGLGSAGGSDGTMSETFSSSDPSTTLSRTLSSPSSPEEEGEEEDSIYYSVS